MMTILLESAARTLVLAAAAWVALRILRVRHVVAQKIAWTLVLAAAVTMPFLARWHWITLRPVTVPASWVSAFRASASPTLATVPATAHHDVAVTHAAVVVPPPAQVPEPAAASAIATPVIKIAPA